MAETRRFVFANFARSTLAARISASATQLRVATDEGDRFPSPDGTYDEIFALTLTNGPQYEIVYCTARVGDLLTIERGKEGTTPQIFAAASAAVHNVTAAFWEQMSVAPPAPLGVQFLGFQGGSESSVGLVRQVAMTFDDFVGNDRGIFLYAATTNGDTLTNLDTAVYEVEQDGDIIASGSLLPSDQIVFVEVTANCARALIPIGDEGPGSNQVIVRVTYTWLTTGGVTPRRLTVQAAAFSNTNQDDWAEPVVWNEIYDDFGLGVAGDPLSVTPPAAGDLVLSLAMMANVAAVAVLSPGTYSAGTSQTGGSFDFNMAYSVVDDTTPQAVDWTTPGGGSGWLLYAAVIRAAE